MRESGYLDRYLKDKKPLDMPPDGYPRDKWQRALKREAYKEEERRFIDETDPRYAKEKSNRARVRAMQGP